MKIASERVLDGLPAEEPCLGAVFTSYTFSPAFFEEQALRAILRLTSDPVEQAERYHHEARRALQETPVVAIVDAAERQPGRRLPFDLLEVSGVVFHPKAVLLLYREHARLMIGSGNLTFGGYGGNTELFLCLNLSYANPAHQLLLRAFDDHLERVTALVRQPGTQLALFREELQRRLGSTEASVDAADVALLDSTRAPIIEQLKALLPSDASIVSLGTLAPFYERDDGSELDASSVFGALEAQLADGASLDVGVAWENPQAQAAGDSTLAEGLERLWTWTYEKDGVRVLEHLVPTGVGPSTLSFADEAGDGRRWPIDEVNEAIERRELWMQPPPVAFAPKKAIEAARQRFGQVRLWLHPATRLLEGRAVHRPLHAKLLVVGYRTHGRQETIVLMGSPNMSRRALLMRAGSGGGNVELALAFRLASAVSLRDLVPELVHAPASAFELQERTFPELGRNHGLAIEQALHDAKARTLTVKWAPEAQSLPAWRLTYDGKSLAASDQPPTADVNVTEFDLKPATAEVLLVVDGREFAVPILIADLAHLPATPASPNVGLEELLLLLGRRIGTERAVQLAERRATGGEDDELGVFFGEGFGPTDVFRAWWSVAQDLADPTLSVPAFRLRLEGALGLGAAWAAMLDATVRRMMEPEETWFYGAELLRELSQVELSPTSDREPKERALAAFCDGVRAGIDTLELRADDRPWVKRILSFYAEARQ